MARGTESPQEDWLIEQLTRRGWLVRKMQWRGIRNGPDLFCAYSGLIVLVENKAERKKAREGQVIEHRKLGEQQVPVICSDDHTYTLSRMNNLQRNWDIEDAD